MVEIESCRILWGLRRLWTLSDLLPLKLKQVEHVHWPSKLKTGQRSIIKLITGSFQQSSCISFSNKSRSGWRFKSRDLDLRIAEDSWGFLRILGMFMEATETAGVGVSLRAAEITEKDLVGWWVVGNSATLEIRSWSSSALTQLDQFSFANWFTSLEFIWANWVWDFWGFLGIFGDFWGFFGIFWGFFRDSERFFDGFLVSLGFFWILWGFFGFLKDSLMGLFCQFGIFDDFKRILGDSLMICWSI